MGRCEGYYRVESRRCDREASALTRVGEADYAVCDYHRRESRPVARWLGDGDRRLPAQDHVRRVA